MTFWTFVGTIGTVILFFDVTIFWFRYPLEDLSR